MKRMLPLTVRLLTSALFIATACSGTAVITKVTVRNAEFQKIRTLASPSELERFNLLFANKKKTKRPEPVTWTYKLDLEGDGQVVRWLYHPDGWLRILSKADTPVYVLDSPTEFRKLVLE